MSEKKEENVIKFETNDNNKIIKTNLKENENLQKEKNQEQNILLTILFLSSDFLVCSFGKLLGTGFNDLIKGFSFFSTFF